MATPSPQPHEANTVKDESQSKSKSDSSQSRDATTPSPSSATQQRNSQQPLQPRQKVQRRFQIPRRIRRGGKDENDEKGSAAWSTQGRGRGWHMPSELKERLRHFTWTWFTMSMATGGIANVLYSVPEPMRFRGLWTIGCIIFLFNILLFFFNLTAISLRFHLFPNTFTASFLHPTESLFIPAAVISFGTILINITQYGVGNKTGPWLDHVMVVMYWIYCAMAVLLSSGIYLIMWSTTTFTISQMTPVWIFPAYPLLIVGPFAAQLAPKLSPERALPVIVGGFILQGIGFMVSLMIYSAYVYRLMTQKLPKEGLRPGMFISVGPSGFTISAIVNMGQQLPRVVGADFMGPGLGEFAAKVSLVAANWVGLWLWGLAMWFFFVAVAAHFSSVAHHRMHFAMNWYSFVFPNTALTTSTFAIAKALNDNRSFKIVGCVLAICLIMMWMFVFGMMIRAVYLKQILWPQMQEDRDEGGWGKDKKTRREEVLSGNRSREGSFANNFSHATGIPLGDSGVFDPNTADFDEERVAARQLQDEEKGGAGWISWRNDLGRNGEEKGKRRVEDREGADLELQMSRVEKWERMVNPARLGYTAHHLQPPFV